MDDPKDIAYTTAGCVAAAGAVLGCPIRARRAHLPALCRARSYAPLSVRIVERALTTGWGGAVGDALSHLPGDTTEVTQDTSSSKTEEAGATAAAVLPHAVVCGR